MKLVSPFSLSALLVSVLIEEEKNLFRIQKEGTYLQTEAGKKYNLQDYQSTGHAHKNKKVPVFSHYLKIYKKNAEASWSMETMISKAEDTINLIMGLETIKWNKRNKKG